jgi:polyisoprenoid-binding protein YceI
MALNRVRVVRAVTFFGLGLAAGAAGGPWIYTSLHPSFRQRRAEGPSREIVVAPPPEVPVPVRTEEQPAPAEVPKPPDREVPPEPVPESPPAGPEFFGFRVNSSDRAPAPKPAPEPTGKPETAPAPAPTVLRLRLMKGRCVGGFDGTSTVLDFSGWTRSLKGELTYEKGRLAETARGHVTADPATLDTGDRSRDKEIRESILETAKYPEMHFDVSFLEVTGVETINMSGTMEIHGVKKYVTIPCSIRLRRDGYAWMKGEIKLNMSSFGIKPPVKLAVIKVADQIRIWFEIWAEPVKEPK